VNAALASAAVEAAPRTGAFPIPLEAYTGEQGLSLPQVLLHRVDVDPFNAVATAIFLLAILHTFAAPRFLALSHRLHDAHEKRGEGADKGIGFLPGLFHFLGEVEAVFGIWVLPLLAVLVATKGWKTAERFIHSDVNFTEAVFVVVIMTISSTRPVLDLAERALGTVALLGRRSPLAWWLSILTLGPLVGSFITEPAAMSICAILLGRQIFELKPRPVFRYATLGLLFVNISVGGTLTHFAAPPVLMVAGRWGWDLSFMLTHFGDKAALGIAISNVLYALFFRRDFRELAESAGRAEGAASADASAPELPPVPAWVTVTHLIFLAFTVFTAHTPALFIGAFLFFLAFTEATSAVQSPVNLRPPLLVGFFLAGLVVHGTLQAWWIAPILSRLSELPLMIGATVLTAFNDNAAITYLASLVPGFSDAAKYAVVAGAVTGGGLTVIANAPNPAGQAILGKYFEDGISPLGLLLGAAVPTVVMALCFLLI
jgi:hypothetical protein